MLKRYRTGKVFGVSENFSTLYLKSTRVGQVIGIWKRRLVDKTHGRVDTYSGIHIHLFESLRVRVNSQFSCDEVKVIFHIAKASGVSWETDC